MGDDLEFTEEDMFSHLDETNENNRGLGNLRSESKKEAERLKSEKLKRQRSSIPEDKEWSDDDASPPTTGRKSPELLNPVSSYFNSQGVHPPLSQSMNRPRQIPVTHDETDEPGEEEKRSLSRLGTSMPITIPGMEKAMLAKKNSKPQDVHRSSTFVPPHLMDQKAVEARAQSVNSGSVAKRDRLLQRNKILRRTGFLEAGGLEAGSENGGLPELMDPLNRRLMPIRESSYKEQSALTTALGTPQKK